MDRLNQMDDNPALRMDVKQIFESTCIFEDAMREFQNLLKFFKKNEFGYVWRDENELREKAMDASKKFVNDVLKNFRSKHSEIAQQIEGSACDVFETFFTEKLGESDFGKDSLFKYSFQETKKEFSRRIFKLKEKLEREEQKGPKTTSDIEEMISQTELFDPIHIHHALLCCRVAYDCEDPKRPERTLEDLGEKHLLGELIVSHENDKVPRYVMARCGDVLYVTFRGLPLCKCAGPEEADWRGCVSKGGIEQAKKIPLGYFAREILQERRIIFSGHSTGGTIAALVAIFLLDKLKQLPKDYLESNLKCIAFGLTPFGNSLFKDYAESMPDCFCHIVKKDDVVPKLFGINSSELQDFLLKMVNYLIQIPLNALNQDLPNFRALNRFLEKIFQLAGETGTMGGFFTPVFDIFGSYYLLDYSIREDQKYRVLSASQARTSLTFRHPTYLMNIKNFHLLNHRIERYQHDVRVCLLGELPELQKFSRGSVKKSGDIAPKISKVQFENIGNRVVAKIEGRNMWFVYEVSIGGDEDLPVDYMKSTESEVQTRMPRSHVSYPEFVTVRVKTHFENSKHIPTVKVHTETTNYKVSRRQEQLSKHSPCGVIELAYLSALLERRDNESNSKRYNAIKTFFTDAVSVVPIESLFHAMATARPYTVHQCCELFLSGRNILPSPAESSRMLLDEMRRALIHVAKCRWNKRCEETEMSDEEAEMSDEEAEMYDDDSPSIPVEEDVGMSERVPITVAHVAYIPMRYSLSESSLCESGLKISNRTARYGHTSQNEDPVVFTSSSFRKAVLKMKEFVYEAEKPSRKLKILRAKSLCDLNLGAIYPSSDADDEMKVTPGCCKTPMALLIDGRKELNRFSEEMSAKLEANGEEGAASNYNTEMLKVLNQVRTNFETCSALLGAFMEAQVQIPLEKQDYANTIAKHAKSFGLDLWGLLILPFTCIEDMLNRFSFHGSQRLVVDIASSVYALHDRFTVDSRHLPNYDGKLEFLLASTKKSFTSNKEFVSYSLERQLVEECENRNIFAQTSLEDILQQWQANFKDETLTLVPDHYRPLVARWIKWSLMINRLRESIAEQTAVGVIGLVNSGKSKFVRSLFGIETITGTTAAKRTTVPFIYNLEPEIKGMDVIDFPGVDDQDETIPELAELLLSLARIVVFIVDYKRAHTQATKDWLNVLEKENVPVLICLSFADKLYAELMGEEGLRDVKGLKTDIQTQLEDVENQIGQPEIGRREFRFTVFAFDNDSNLNCEVGKDKLRQAGLSDELDVGRWIAEKLEDNKQSDLSQRVFSFIKRKEKSTLNSNKSTRKRGKSTAKPLDSDSGNVPTKRKDVKDSLNPDC